MKKKNVSRNKSWGNSEKISTQKKRRSKNCSSNLNKIDKIIVDVKNKEHNILSNQTFYQIFELIEEILALQKEKFPNDYKKSCEVLFNLMQIKVNEPHNSYSDYSKDLLNVRINIEKDYESMFMILKKAFSLLELALTRSAYFGEKFPFDLLKFFNEELKRN